MKKLRYALEGVFLYLLFGLFRITGPEKASNFGGWIGRTIGPRMAVSRKARANIALAFPELPEDRREAILTGMWDNLGRVIAEYPHLETLSWDYTKITGTELLAPLFECGGPAVFIGAHFGNWEVNCAAFLTQLGRPIDLTYREPNNPWTAKLLDRARTLGGRLRGFPKSAESGRGILGALRENRYLGILIDQKYNEGVAVPFFGHEAMTNPIFVQLAQRYQCPVFPAKIERIEGCRFKGTVYPALKLFDEQGNALPIEEVIKEAHGVLEGWIRERPEQWLWLHRRWPKDGESSAQPSSSPQRA